MTPTPTIVRWRPASLPAIFVVTISGGKIPSKCPFSKGAEDLDTQVGFFDVIVVQEFLAGT